MIDDSFVWGMCGFTVWRCITGAYLGVYLIHESSGSRVMFVVCQILILWWYMKLNVFYLLKFG